MRRAIRAGLIGTIGLGFGVAPGFGQVIERERDVTITGPRGRSIQRDFRSERGPGFLDRQTEIRRPGGTFERDVRIQQRPGFVGPGPIPRGGWAPMRGWGPRPIVERPVYINNGPGLLPELAIGAGLFGLGMLTGSSLASPPPPPVYLTPPPPPVVVYNPPQPYGAAPTPPTVVIDPVADAMGRLQSHHNHSRRDGAITLGRLRDARAVPALVDRLKNDGDKDVRVASATALGEIGDPRAIPFLERATVYDKKQPVRDASATALSRFPRQAPASTASLGSDAAPSVTVPSLEEPSAPAPIENVPPPPRPEPGFRNTP